MSDSVLVEVSHGGHDLHDDVGGILFRVHASLHDLVEELLALHPIIIRSCLRDQSKLKIEQREKKDARGGKWVWGKMSDVQLHDEVELLVIFVDLVELEDVGVIKLLHDLNFSPQKLDVVALHHLLLNTLDGELATGLLVGLVHDGETTPVSPALAI